MTKDAGGRETRASRKRQPDASKSSQPEKLAKHEKSESKPERAKKGEKGASAISCAGQNITFQIATTYGSSGEGEGEFSCIGAMALSHGNAKQRLAVADCFSNRVLVFDVESRKCVATIGTTGSEEGELDYPNGVAFNAQGDLVVSDFSNCRVQVFDLEGNVKLCFGSDGSDNGELGGPLGLAVNSAGDIIVCEKRNDRVQIFRKDGTFVRAFGSDGAGEGEFQGPCAVDVGKEGQIVVADPNNYCVQVFDKAGKHVRTIRVGKDELQLMVPCSVKIGPGGEIYILDGGRKDVQVFTAEGVYIRTICKYGGGGDVDMIPGQGLAVDEGGNVYVGRMRIGESGDDELVDIVKIERVDK